MIFEQFKHERGGCLSYLIGCTQARECAVIDPQYDPEPYTSYAKQHDLRITHVFETHAQADHISGSRRLGETTGALLHVHESAEPAFRVDKMKDGDELKLGNILLKILHTPGHTADSVSILVSDTTRSREPWFVFTGDTLFVGDTGRPDLDGSAEQLYDSVFGKLLQLRDNVEIYPTHFAGSSCGKAMSSKTSSTIGFEKLFNPSLRMRSKEEFVQFVTADLPVQPPQFHKVRQYNLGMLKEPPIERTYDMNDLQISVEQLKERLDRGEKIVLLDVREPWEFKRANLGGKLIPMGEIPNRLGELDKSSEIIVYCHHGNRSRRVVEYLYGNGFTKVKNMVGGIEAWSSRIDPNIPKY